MRNNEGSVARRIQEQDLQEIEEAVRPHPEGMTAQQIADALKAAPPRRTLQYRLKSLVDDKRLFMEGEGRWARYRTPQIAEAVGTAAGKAEVKAVGEAVLPLSAAGKEIQAYVRQPVEARRHVGYERGFLDAYRPNETSIYVQKSAPSSGKSARQTSRSSPPAPTQSRSSSRLLIDLSWNSSRLEGNTYSLLDTKRLIDFGEQAEGKDRLEAQMILNHKDAIEFLVSAPERSALTATRSSISMACSRTTCWPIRRRRAGFGILPSASRAPLSSAGCARS